MDEEFLFKTFHAREAYLRGMGDVDELVLAPLRNPAEMGGPVWPSVRESWRTVQNGRRKIIVSDGLSDPFEKATEPNVGFGIEVLAATDDRLPDNLQASWLFKIVYRVSQEAAAHGGYRSLIDELGILSMEIDAPDGSESVAAENGIVGLLLGVGAPDLPMQWDLPAGVVKVITVKLLCPTELAYVVEHGEEGRARLAQMFSSDCGYHLSSLDRSPVV